MNLSAFSISDPLPRGVSSKAMAKKRLAYKPLRGAISDSSFRSGRISLSRDVKVPEQFEDLLLAAQKFDNGRGFIAEYQVIAIGEDARTKTQISFTVQRLTHLYYLSRKGKEVFEKYIYSAFEEWEDEAKEKSYFDLQFFRVVLITDATKKKVSDAARQARAEKQAKGRLEAQRERELQKREASQAKARRTRQENIERQKQGLPKLKRRH